MFWTLFPEKKLNMHIQSVASSFYCCELHKHLGFWKQSLKPLMIQKSSLRNYGLTMKSSESCWKANMSKNITLMSLPSCLKWSIVNIKMVYLGNHLLSMLKCINPPVISNSLYPMDCSPPGSSVHGSLQARILEWVAISFSRGSSQSRDRTSVSHMACRFFTVWAML